MELPDSLACCYVFYLDHQREVDTVVSGSNTVMIIRGGQYFVVCNLLLSSSWASHDCQGSSQVLHEALLVHLLNYKRQLFFVLPACSCSQGNLSHAAIHELDVGNLRLYS